jgi:hypothetical protein
MATGTNRRRATRKTLKELCGYENKSVSILYTKNIVFSRYENIYL